MISAFTVPVVGLHDMSNESRMMATPWSRLVRGIGLGQYPVAFDPSAAEHIRYAFNLLAKKLPTHEYTRFAQLTADLVLTAADPEQASAAAAVQRKLGPVVDAIRSEPNRYYRVMAGCILMDALAKLGLDRSLLVAAEVDVPGEILADADDIKPDRIQDENRGQHGAYERVSAYSGVFLALGQLGLKDRLVSGERNFIRTALELLRGIPSPFFRVRAGAMLLSVISLLGFDELAFDGDRDYMRDILDCLDVCARPDVHPSFPQPVTPRFAKAYPLFTVLNAIAASGRAEYLTYGTDWLAEAKELMSAISPPERTHMALYYIVGLHNLGRLGDQIPDLDAYLEAVVGHAEILDPGTDFFLHGVAYPYLIETAMITGRADLISPRMIDRLVEALPDLDRAPLDRINRPFTLSYCLTALADIGVADRLFTPSVRYGGESPLAWTIGRLSDGGREESGRLNMIHHSLLNYALRLRGPDRRDSGLFRGYRFRLAAY